MGNLDPRTVYETIEKIRDWYWSDAERHRVGRLDLAAARREVVRLSLTDIGLDAPDLADRIGNSYDVLRHAGIRPFEGAIPTVRWLRDSGCRLALLTNGSSDAQRSKIARFGLAELFDAILIEGELGFGKPDPRVYLRALAELDVSPSHTWMVGDNLEWDVAQPQRHGILGIWIDGRGAGVPPGRSVQPDRIIRRLADLRDSR
jgi:putative hydrolase of the HAD superfamily